MELQHIDLTDLKTTTLNVRKTGAKDIADILPSIRSLGVLQPLLVRKNCEGYEIIAGQRRYHAAVKVAQETAQEGAQANPLPCIIMQEDDDAKAIEASLVENIARLPMDEIDQYKAFAALTKQGKSIQDIASDFGITERLVKQRLAIANLIAPILAAYRKEKISAGTVRSLTLATKRQQKEWWALFKSDEYAPQGHALKEWLFGGARIPTTNALFDLEQYGGCIVADLFGEESYFDDADKFWELQNTAIAKARDTYHANGWSEVNVLEVGAYWASWEYSKIPKLKGGQIYVQIATDGEVTFHEGFLPEKQAKRLAVIENGETVADEKPTRPELTKAMQNYLDLHRHAAVRSELLNHQDVALRLALAQMIAGSDLWVVQSDPQKANTDAIKESLTANKAEDVFAQERAHVCSLLEMDHSAEVTLVYRKDDWGKCHDLHAIFAKLKSLSDDDVMRILTFVTAETLPCGSEMVEGLGAQLNVNMAESWQPDEVFFDLLRDKEAINGIVKELAGKASADAHISATAKVQKKIIQDCLNGTRTSKQANWQPRYIGFPCKAYAKRGGIDAIARWKRVKKHYA